ncbi:beta strand repeat-containing protein [Aquirhabdus parva]|uniref:Big-1 domain-containing protein n=1 Tax=Aquirhabdus parva TaxID=2283318 RepID=A0A345P402_9GAMM|nr:hypothetical protein [Aquirhabdus parva]AXI02011.1 hypothetical protein HYN46_03505 [Aquirhabdus parva]
MDINLQNGRKMKHLFQLTALSTALVVAGCGGGGGGGFYGPETPTTPITPTAPLAAPNSIAVSQSKATLSTGGDSITLTFRVLDKNGGAILKAPLAISIANLANSGASLSTPSAIVTDATTGLATVTLTLANDVVDYRINRNIALTVTSTQAGVTATQQLVIPTTGTKLTLATNSSTLTAGQSAQVSATAVDGVGQLIAGATVNLLDSAGKVIPGIASQKTGTNGVATFSVPATAVPASGQLTVTGQLVGNVDTTITQTGNNSVTLTASIPNQAITFLSSSSALVNINTNASLAVQVQAATQAELTGQNVTFVTSQGLLSLTSAPITNIAKNASGNWVGTAETTLSSGSPGTATVVASFGKNTVTGNVQIISTIPAAMTLQSGTSVLAPKANTTIIALVKDVNGAPVSNAVVKFAIATDPSGGSLSSPLATTDGTGQASVTYTAGATSTLTKAISITATVTGSAGGAVVNGAAPVTLTVAGQSAYITISQDNTVVLVDTAPTYYFKNFSESVVDINGGAIANQQVSVSLVPQSYMKGYYVYDKTASLWEQVVTATCSATTSSPFVNPVALLSSTASGASLNFVTGTQGSFDYQIRYGKNYANWVTLSMNASTVVGTNQTVTGLSITPPVLGTDISGPVNVAPPNAISPFNPIPKPSDFDPTTPSGYTAAYLATLHTCP